MSLLPAWTPTHAGKWSIKDKAFLLNKSLVPHRLQEGGAHPFSWHMALSVGQRLPQTELDKWRNYGRHLLFPRRFTWELIRSHRGRATIVFTTHSMEEAELLADDVVIMVSWFAAFGAQHSSLLVLIIQRMGRLSHALYYSSQFCSSLPL